MPVKRERKEREGNRVFDADDSKSRKGKWDAIPSGNTTNELSSSSTSFSQERQLANSTS
jgi:hypothetical protein